MKIKKVLAVITAIAILLLCSGCSLNLFSVESLLTPPVQSGKNGEVQEAFGKLKGKEKIQLKTPVSGDFQSSFVFFDIDGDDVDESLVFYSDSSVESSVRMALMTIVDGDWVISADIKGAGSGVFDVSFSDLDSDGMCEIFVSWSLFDNKTTYIISIYAPVLNSDNTFNLDALGNEYCNSKSFADFNGDLKNDLVLVYLDDTGAVPKSFLRLFSLSQNRELVKYAEVRLDGAITSVVKIQSDIIKAEHNSYSRLFIDCRKTDRVIFTEMVYWDVVNSAPVRAIKNPSVTTARSIDVQCRDIDGDGYTEIPVLTKLQGDEKMFSVTDYNEIYTFTLLEWSDATGDTERQNIKTLYNPLDSYLFLFPWNGTVSVRYDTGRDALLFCEWSESEKKYKDELFSVAFRESYDTEVYGVVLYESQNGRYYYEITESGESFGITDEVIISSFIK